MTETQEDDDEAQNHEIAGGGTGRRPNMLLGV
jgi:hypothetical protein